MERSWHRNGGPTPYLNRHVDPTIRIRLYADSKMARHIYCYPFEVAEQIFLHRFLQPGDVFVDVGANIGLFSLIGGRRVGPHGRGFSFEPAGVTFQRLCENLQLNGLFHVEALRVALSESAGMLPMTVSTDGYDAYNSLAKPSAGTDFATEMVPAQAWDEFAAEHDLVGRVALMKIDVEGWESQVLRGAQRTLERADAPVLLIEFTEANARNAGTTCQALYDQIQALGYQLFFLDSQRGVLRPEPRRDRWVYTNLVGAKRADEVASRLGLTSFSGAT